MPAIANMPRRLFNLFLFSSVFIALGAVLMVHQTVDLSKVSSLFSSYYYFVFFSTLCSYNFHWYLTSPSPAEQLRVAWTQDHRKLHLLLFLIGGIGASYFSLLLIKHILWIALSVVLTFLYSAPKISFPPFTWLRKIAVGKTIFLSVVWMYVTTLLPLIISDTALQKAEWLFCTSRYFLIYSICIIFDYRDRAADKAAGIRSLITYFSEHGVNRIFYVSIACFFLSTACLLTAGFTVKIFLLLMLPGIAVFAIYNYAKRNFSDYLYYFVLDGLMMISAIFTAFI